MLKTIGIGLNEAWKRFAFESESARREFERYKQEQYRQDELKRQLEMSGRWGDCAACGRCRCCGGKG